MRQLPTQRKTTRCNTDGKLGGDHEMRIVADWGGEEAGIEALRNCNYLRSAMFSPVRTGRKH